MSKWGFDWSQESTKRNLVWVPTGLAVLAAYFLDKDITPLLGAAAAIAGGLGVFRKDN